MLPSTLKNQLYIYSREIKNVANKGFFHLFTSYGLVLVVGFVSQFFVAGFLDPTDMGRIKIMQTYINLAALVCGLGFDISLLKLASENRDEAERKRMYQAGCVVALISFTFLFLLLYLLNALGMISSDSVLSQIFPLYVLFLLPSSLQTIQMAYYQAKKEIKRLAKLQVVIKLLSVLLIVASTFFFKLNGYVISVVLTGFLAIILLDSGIKNFGFRLTHFKFESRLLKNMWNLARFVLITNFVGMLTATTDIFLINYLVTDRKEVGYYMFALTVLSVYQILPVTIQKVAFPFFSEQSIQYEKWYSSYSKYNKLNHILVLFIFAAGVLLIPVLISFAFSGKYDRSIYYFSFLSLSWLIKSSNMMKGTAIMGHGRFDVNLKSEVILLVLSFPILFVLIKYFGLNGAIIGKIIEAVISYITFGFVFRQFHKKYLKPAKVETL